MCGRHGSWTNNGLKTTETKFLSTGDSRSKVTLDTELMKSHLTPSVKNKSVNVMTGGCLESMVSQRWWPSITSLSSKQYQACVPFLNYLKNNLFTRSEPFGGETVEEFSNTVQLVQQTFVKWCRRPERKWTKLIRRIPQIYQTVTAAKGIFVCKTFMSVKFNMRVWFDCSVWCSNIQKHVHVSKMLFESNNVFL